MSRIFLSHSSADEREAVALKHWLAENGWDDVFLDVDPQRGLAAGERWQEALRKAADRCEAVLFIVSPAWAKSKWCLAEFLLAKSLHKLIFGVVLKDVPITELPTEMTSEWQLSRLVGEGSNETIRFPYRETTDATDFLAEGLRRLRDGLSKAGLNANYFPWPPHDNPQRAPYRGLEPLEASDAAVFFGRDVEIQRGLDAIRGMRDAGDKHLFIILGASGAGKSSFLRAGLLPRLARDDRHFFPLAPLRPEREPLFGERGLAHTLHHAWQALKLPATHLGDIKSRLRAGPAGLAALLQQLQEAARGRMLGVSEAALPPTLVLPIDQAEELFNADAGQEARGFLQLLGGVLGAADGIARVSLIVTFTIRSDRYEPLQTAPELVGLQSVVFDDLKPMLPTRFREIILGPAKRASDEGRKLVVQPELVDQLVKECHEGADPLPLLGLTLARLYRDYGGDGDLRLDEYQTMGGLANIVKSEAESVLSTDEAIRQKQLELLHAAFIPWLATINPQNDQPMRRLARRSDLADAHSLIDALAEKRLLLTDQRNGIAAVEIAHEALLRQWDILADWLVLERDDLTDADALERTVLDWEKNERKDAWVTLEGERLTIAEALAAKPGFSRRLEGSREFLQAARKREDARREAAERHRRAELDAAQRSKRITSVVIGAVLSISGIGAGAWYSEFVKTQAEKTRTDVEKTRRIGAEGIAALKRGELSLGWHLVAEAAARVPRDAPPPEEVELALDEVRSHPRPPVILRGHDSPITKVILSPDGRRALTASEDGTARLWDIETGRNVATLRSHQGTITAVDFSHDGTLIATGSDDSKVRLWDARSGQENLPVLGEHEDSITKVAFCGSCTRLLTASRDGTAIIWDSTSGKRIRKLPEHEGPVLVSALSPDGSYALTASDTHKALLWKVDSDAPPMVLDQPGGIALGTFTVDGKHVVVATDRGSVRVWDMSGKEIYGWVEKDGATPYDTDGERIVLQSFGANHWRTIVAEVATGRHIVELNTNTRIEAAALSADGTMLVTADENQVGHVWDTVSGREKTVLRGHRKLARSVSINTNRLSAFSTPTSQSRRALFSVAISADGKHVITGLDDQMALLWETSAFQTVVTMKAYASANAVAFSPDGRHLLAASDDQSARLWNIDGRKLAVLRGHDNAVTSAAVGPTGESIVTGSLDGTARLWNLAGKELATLTGHDRALSSVAFSRDGKWILSASDDGSARLWEAGTGRPAAVMRGHRGAVRQAIFSPDGQRVATIAADETARLWNLEGKEAAVLKGHDDALLSVAFSADSKLLATGSRDATIRLWNTGDGRLVHVLKGHRDSVAALAFSPDGKWLASGGGDRDVRIWDVEKEKERTVLKGHDDAINALAFSPDGTSLASGSDDKTAREWDVATWRQKGKFAGHTSWIGALAYSPDGTRIATASEDHTVRIWAARRSMRDQADYARAMSPELADAALMERLGLMPEPSFERTIPQRGTASACDQLAAHPFDSARVASGVIWSKLDGDTQAAVTACRHAVASEPGNARLQYQLGRALENFADPAARAELAKAAEAGYARAQGALGSLLIDTGEDDDFRGGVQWLKRAVNAGDTIAQYTLADLLLDGKRLPQDQLEAKRLFTLAATQGHPDSHGKLAEMAEKGELLPGAGPNSAAAFFHHTLAARTARAVSDDATARSESERRAAIARLLPEATVIALWRKAAQWKPGQMLDLQP